MGEIVIPIFCRLISFWILQYPRCCRLAALAFISLYNPFDCDVQELVELRISRLSKSKSDISSTIVTLNVTFCRLIFWLSSAEKRSLPWNYGLVNPCFTRSILPSLSSELRRVSMKMLKHITTEVEILLQFQSR